MTANEVPKIETPSLFWYSVKMVFALFVVLGLILFFAYILRKFGTRTFHMASKGVVDVVEVVPILNRWYVILLKVGDRFFLVGCSENNIRLLGVLSKGDIEERNFESTIKKVVEGIEEE
ncbi:MAG: FliO/MopB family protein [Thermosulfidibacteraceae bacterium]|jgi:flagellar biosynthetic protein FliO